MLAKEGAHAAEECEGDAAPARAEAVVVGLDRQIRTGSVAVEDAEEGGGDGRGFFGGGGIERRQCRRVVVIIIRLDRLATCRAACVAHLPVASNKRPRALGYRVVRVELRNGPLHSTSRFTLRPNSRAAIGLGVCV